MRREWGIKYQEWKRVVWLISLDANTSATMTWKMENNNISKAFQPGILKHDFISRHLVIWSFHTNFDGFFLSYK